MLEHINNRAVFLSLPHYIKLIIQLVFLKSSITLHAATWLLMWMQFSGQRDVADKQMELWLFDVFHKKMSIKLQKMDKCMWKALRLLLLCTQSMAYVLNFNARMHQVSTIYICSHNVSNDFLAIAAFTMLQRRYRSLFSLLC